MRRKFTIHGLAAVLMIYPIGELIYSDFFYVTSILLFISLQDVFFIIKLSRTLVCRPPQINITVNSPRVTILLFTRPHRACQSNGVFRDKEGMAKRLVYLKIRRGVLAEPCKEMYFLLQKKRKTRLCYVFDMYKIFE